MLSKKRRSSGRHRIDLQQDLAKRSRRGRLQRRMEHLEPRQMLASLAGEVWADTNGNGVRESSEKPVISARVYVDLNDDRQFDANEPFTRTDGTGQYAFDVIAAGAHVVRVELGPGQNQTSPSNFYGSSLNVGADQTDSLLFKMDQGGNITTQGATSAAAIDGLVETNTGEVIGVDSSADMLYRIDPTSGAANLLSTPGVDLQAGLAYDPNTDSVFTVANVGGEAQLRVVDYRTGQLSEPAATLANLRAMNFGSTFFDFDPSTGTAVEQPKQILSSAFASTLDARSDGAIFGLQGDTLNQFSFPAEGSEATTISTLSQAIEAISFGANDQLFGVSTSPSTFHQIDVASGAVSDGIPLTFNGASISSLTGFDIAPDGTHYIVDSTHLYTFDPNTGVATRKPNRGVTSRIFTSLSVAENGRLYGTLFNVDTPLAEINPQTGIATPLGNSPEGAPYASVVGAGTISTAAGLTGVVASDLTFDPVQQRIIGFDDATDQFFQFDTSGRGSILATTQRALNSSSLSFDGSRFVMFDADDPSGQSVVEVDPDTGTIRTRFQSSAAVAAATLDLSVRDTAHRVTVTSSDAIVGLNFGLNGRVNRPDFGEGIYINELVIDVEFEDRNTHQAIELRGQPGAQIAANTYLVLVKENSTTASHQFEQGHVHGVFDLSGQTFGSNGFLVMLPQDSPYAVHADSAVLRSTASGFSGLPGGIFTHDDSNGGGLGPIIGSTGFFLVQSEVAPAVGNDIDVDDDGFADPGGLFEDWDVLDSIALHPHVGGGEQTYADVAFVDPGPSESRPVIRREDAQVFFRDGRNYAARIGDSLGSDESDWVVGTAIDIAAPGDPFELGLEDGVFGTPIPEVFKARSIDHFGESNFVGGVRGTVRLAPIVEGESILPPATNVTVLADTNGNGRQDELTFRLDPDSFPIGADLTHVLPGATISTITPGFNLPTGSTGFKVQPVGESLLSTQLNRIFSHEGINFFNQDSRHFRATFQRPASAVSIVGLSARNPNLQTVIRLDAYDVNGNLLGSDTSNVLTNSQQELLSLDFATNVIAYAEAYAVTEDTTIGGITVAGTPFGRLDRFSYSQFEATTTTNEFGEYELPNLIPDNYQITYINPDGNPELSGAQRVPLTILRYENFLLRPNPIPVTSDVDITIDENLDAGTVIGQIVGSDNDGPVEFSILDGQQFGVQVDAVTGELTVAPGATLDFESTPSFQITVGVSDLLGAVTASVVAVTLTDLNEAPVIQPILISVPEDRAIGNTVGRIRATDPDTQPNDRSLTYSATGGTGASLFSVDPNNGTVTLTNPQGLDFEAASELTLDILVTDSGTSPQSATAVQVITITDANDTPVLTTPPIVVAENTTGVIGSVTVDDADQGQSQFLQIDGGTGAGLFSIGPNGAISVRPGASLDFETATSYTLNVTVVDSGVPTLTDSGVVDITVTDINEPAQINFVSQSIGENAVAGTLVSQIDLTDAEGAVENYSVTLLDELDGGLFELMPIQSSNDALKQFELVVKDGAQFDFETAPSVSVAFQVDDLTGASESLRVERVIAVENENDPPSVVTNSINVSEGAVPGDATPLARIRFADVDPGEVFTARIIGGSGANQFVLDPVTHILTVAEDAQLDADVADPTLTLEVEVTDAGGKTGTGTILVQLNNVNEAPVFQSTIGDVDLVSGQPFEFVFDDSFVIDPESGTFQVSVFSPTGSLPEWIRYNAITRTLTAMPNPTTVGDVDLVVRAFELNSTQRNDLPFSFSVQAGSQPLTNQRDRPDVDDNRQVTPSDALVVINFLATFGNSSVASGHPFSGFVDVDGNGRVTPLDLLLVINALAEQNANRAPGTVPQGEQIDFLDSDREDSVDEVFASLSDVSLF